MPNQMKYNKDRTPLVSRGFLEIIVDQKLLQNSNKPHFFIKPRSSNKPRVILFSFLNQKLIFIITIL